MEIKALVAITALLLAASSISSVQQDSFETYKNTFTKTYSGSEDSFRQAVYLANVAKIESHNADSTQTYTMGINQFTDMTQEEFESTILMPTELALPYEESQQTEEIFETVGDVNWVSAGAVSRVKDQGRCGSCWAFSASCVTESKKFLTTGTLGSFSEQQLTSCDTSSFGCSGGYQSTGINYYANNGICTSASYPYTSGSSGQSGTCLSGCTKDSFSISGNTRLSSGYSALTSALGTEPVSVAVDAGNWSSYSSGIFSNCGTAINHAVLAAGYTSSYLLIKNSWGAAWGESGYIRLAPGSTCAVDRQNYIVRV